MTLFLYGTLRHRPLFHTVAGPGVGPGAATAQPCTLPGHAVDVVAGGTLPMLLPRAGAMAEGEVWTGLSTAQRARLDLYEVAFGYEVRPVTVTLAGGATLTAEAYFPPAVHQPSGVPWSLPAWEAIGARAAVLAAREVDAHDPPLTGPEIYRQWPMAQMRAEARVRAEATAAPATLRHQPGPEDSTYTLAAPLAGGFFKLAKLTLRHRQFNGAMSPPLVREAMIGADAALVLPYDAARDRVLLIEQFRTGPALRHDRNPWSLEPVAGIVDAGETPEQAGRRECLEEADLSLGAMTHMFSIYASPGSGTDHFHCYLGAADLPSLAVDHGGLASEDEDLRRHVLPLDAALALVDSGEATAGPMVAMLLWLARHRAQARH